VATLVSDRLMPSLPFFCTTAWPPIESVDAPASRTPAPVLCSTIAPSWIDRWPPLMDGLHRVPDRVSDPGWP